MAGSLALSLNDSKDNFIGGMDKNIINSVSDAFSKAFKKGTEKISFPDDIGEKVKEGIEKIDLKEIGSTMAVDALKIGLKKLGIKTSTFNNVKDVFEAVKEGDLKKGLSSGINVAISALKIPQSAKNMIKEGKNLIIEKTFEDELKNVMKKQQNTISRIDKKVIQMEEAFQKNDIKTLDKVYKSLKTDMDKVVPIKDVIERGNSMLNKYELFKNKGNVELSTDELELCDKLSNLSA